MRQSTCLHAKRNQYKYSTYCDMPYCKRLGTKSVNFHTTSFLNLFSLPPHTEIQSHAPIVHLMKVTFQPVRELVSLVGRAMSLRASSIGHFLAAWASTWPGRELWIPKLGGGGVARSGVCPYGLLPVQPIASLDVNRFLLVGQFKDCQGSCFMHSRLSHSVPSSVVHVLLHVNFDW